MSILIEIIVFICLGFGGVGVFLKNIKSGVKTRLSEIKSQDKIKPATATNSNYTFTPMQQKSILLGLMLTIKGNDDFTDNDNSVLSQVANILNFDLQSRLQEVINIDNPMCLPAIRVALKSLKAEQIEWFMLMLSCVIVYNDKFNANRIDKMKYVLSLMDLNVDDALFVFEQHYTEEEFNIIKRSLI